MSNVLIDKNGYYEVLGTTLQLIKVRDLNLWVVVDIAIDPAIEQTNPLPLEDAAKEALKILKRRSGA